MTIAQAALAAQPTPAAKPTQVAAPVGRHGNAWASREAGLRRPSGWLRGPTVALAGRPRGLQPLAVLAPLVGFVVGGPPPPPVE